MNTDKIIGTLINSFSATCMKATSIGDRKTIHGDPERF